MEKKHITFLDPYKVFLKEKRVLIRRESAVSSGYLMGGILITSRKESCWRGVNSSMVLSQGFIFS